jgi:phenylacetate-CoA ligase
MNRYLLRKVVYPAYRAIRRDRILAYLAEMRAVQAMEPEQVRRLQWKKLRKLLEYASRHVPYYRRLFENLGASPQDFKGPEDLAALPILRKKDIRFGTDDPLSEIYPRHHLTPGSTSGSTGEKLRFYLSKETLEAGQANVLRMGEWIGIRIGDKMARLGSVPFEPSGLGKMKTALRSWCSNTLFLSHFRLDEASLFAYAGKLKRFKPDMLVGHPSVLTRFAEFMMDSGIQDIRPRAVVVSSETLYEWQREIIEKALGAKVYNHYGCQEFLGLARECSAQHGLHVAADRVYIETVPAEGTSPADGINEIVVTDLDNYGMPFIRYGMGDVANLTWDSCECGLGFPRLESMIGRTFDIIRAPNGNMLAGSFWTLLMREVKGIEEFRVIQEKLGEVTFILVTTDEFSDDARRFILKQVRDACGPDMRVKFDLRDSIETAPGGKYRFVISKIGLCDRP